MSDSLNVTDFSGHLNAKFRVRLSGGEEILELRLIEAVPLGAARAGEAGQRQPFSLVFRGDGQGCFNQQTCRIEHAQLGSLDLFLVPIGPDDVGMRYEAVFN